MMSRFLWSLLLLVLAAQIACAAESPPIDRETLDRSIASAYRGWHTGRTRSFLPSRRFPATRCSTTRTALRLPTARPAGQMVHELHRVQGQGYNSFVAESTNLVHWNSPAWPWASAQPGEFDHGGGVIGAFLYDSYDIRGAARAETRDGNFWTLYGCYPGQGGMIAPRLRRRGRK